MIRRLLALLLSCSMVLTGCSLQNTVQEDTSSIDSLQAEAETSKIQATESETTNAEAMPQENNETETSVDTTTQINIEDYVADLGFTTLNDSDLMRYVEDSVYSDLITQLNSDEYFIENVSTVYISKEYIEELEYNSKENIYFGYTLSELEEQFQGTKFIFTLGDDGQTIVQEFEEYDNTTYNQILKNVAIGSGVILVCVTVSVISGGAGATAISAIFAASAKTGTIFALSSGTISGVTAGIITGITTGDFDESLKATALSGSEGFKWGAISGAVLGGTGEAVALHGATLNGLTMNEAAMIQKESKYPLDLIRQFKSLDEYNVYKDAGLKTQMINGKLALIRDIDLEAMSNLPDGTEVTNLQRMLKGYAPIDPATGKAYQLHHIGQNADGTLAVLTEAEHQGNSAILNTIGKESEIYRPGFDKVRKKFWEQAGKLFQEGLI